MPDRFGIIVLVYQADTGGGTAFNLVLQAGTAAVTKKTVIALPDLEDLLREV